MTGFTCEIKIEFVIGQSVQGQDVAIKGMIHHGSGNVLKNPGGNEFDFSAAPFFSRCPDQADLARQLLRQGSQSQWT